MEKYLLKDNVEVFYVTAHSFPEGITQAHESLHALLPSAQGRRFYGISHPDKSGKIVYKAAVKELFAGEGEQYRCDTFTIPSGEYISELFRGWKGNERVISATFQRLLQHPEIDENGFCLEEYLPNDELRCLVPLAPESASTP